MITFVARGIQTSRLPEKLHVGWSIFLWIRGEPGSFTFRGRLKGVREKSAGLLFWAKRKEEGKLLPDIYNRNATINQKTVGWTEGSWWGSDQFSLGRRRRDKEGRRKRSKGEGRSGPWWMQAERRLASSTFLNVRCLPALDNQHALSSVTLNLLLLMANHTFRNRDSLVNAEQEIHSCYCY